MSRALGFLVLLLALFVVRQAGAAERCYIVGPPGSRQCTDAELDPMAELRAKAPLLAKTVRSVDYVCDRVVFASLNNAPGIIYYHVTCDEGQQYTVGVSAKRVVVWPGFFNGL